MSEIERLYSSLVNQAPIGIFRCDARGHIIFANDALLQMAGMSAHDLSDECWAARQHPDDRVLIQASWAKVQRDSQSNEPVGFRFVRPDGSITSVLMHVIAAVDDAGRVEGYIGVVTDITTECGLRTRAEQLSRLYATLSRVNSIMVRARDVDQLFTEICRAMVEEGQFEQVNVSEVDWERRSKRITHNYGGWSPPEAFYERAIDDPETQSISNIALLTGKTAVINQSSWCGKVSPQLLSRMHELGIGSAISVPLRRYGNIVGTIAIGSRSSDFFSVDVVSLIEEIAHDISFALENIDRIAAVARSERHLNTTLRSIGDAVLVTDRAGRVTLMNPVAENLTGWTEAQAIGHSVEEVFRIISEETREAACNPVARVLRDGMVVGLANHTLLIARDGTERPIADSGAPIRQSEQGEINGAVLVFRDQTDEYRMQKELLESRQLYATLADNVPAGIYLADSAGELRYANAQLLALLGLDAAQLSVEAAAAAVHPEDRERLSRAWFDACSRQEVTDFGAFRYQKADGGIVWVQAMMTPVLDSQSRTGCFVGIVKDITQVREHVERIERLSRFYATVGQINAAIVRCDKDGDLYREITRIAVDTACFEMANICVIDPVSGKVVLAALDSTEGMNELAQAARRLVPRQTLSPVTQQALETGLLAVINDIANEASLNLKQRDFARSVNLASIAAVPMFRFGQVAAVLVLSSAVRDFFTADIQRLLNEISLGVSHALENIQRDQLRQQAVTELARNEERLRLSLSVHDIGIFEIDYGKGTVTFDAVCARILALGEDALEMEAGSVFGLTTAREQARIIQFHDELRRGIRNHYSMISPIPLAGGGMHWVRHDGIVTAERTPSGDPVRLLGVLTDVTLKKSLEDRNRLAANVIDHSSEAILILDAHNRVILANQASSRITGLDPQQVLGQDGLRFQPDYHGAMTYYDLCAVLEAQGSWQGEVWRKLPSGETHPALASVSLLKDEEGTNAHTIVQEIDISTQKEFEQRIRQLAYRDGLTDLPNRTLLRDRVEQNVVSAARENGSLAILFLDLDHFKNINDSLGHAMGDLLLREIAIRLTNAVRDRDTVGRLGGDEFLILLSDTDADAAAHVSHKLLEECSRPIQIESHLLTITPSIGIALYPRDGSNFDELLKSADTAMYRAKDEGRNAYRFYTPEMNQAVFQRMVLESSLRRAIDHDEFILFYQPKFELQSRKLLGVEALIRWHQPEMGMISPAQFIPVAEESDLIVSIGAWVIREACRQAREWRKAGLPPLRIAVNFSARQFAAGNLVEQVTQALASSGLPGSTLEIEITESLLAQDMDYTLEVLQTLKRLGVSVSVDDFGTGYSSLSYLKRFPIDRLKIDQSFVRDLVNDADDRAIATAVVTMGHSLGMRVIAEGVETARQMEILREMGCDEVQGYHLGRPISAAEMGRALRDYYALFAPPE